MSSGDALMVAVVWVCALADGVVTVGGRESMDADRAAKRADLVFLALFALSWKSLSKPSAVASG